MKQQQPGFYSRPLNEADEQNISNDKLYKYIFLYDTFSIVAFPEYAGVKNQLGLIVYCSTGASTIHFLDLSDKAYNVRLLDFFYKINSCQHVLAAVKNFNDLQSSIAYYYAEVLGYRAFETASSTNDPIITTVLTGEDNSGKYIYCSRFHERNWIAAFQSEMSETFYPEDIYNSVEGYITIIKNIDTGLVKICFCFDPAVKVNELIRNGEPVSFVQAMHGTIRLLNYLHQQYAEKLWFGEWFGLSNKDIADISKLVDSSRSVTPTTISSGSNLIYKGFEHFFSTTTSPPFYMPPSF